MTKLTLYTKSNCCLCDEAELTIERVRTELGFRLEKVDISTDTELVDSFGELIPVVFVDGRRVFELRVDEQELRDLLDQTADGKITNGIAGVI